MNTPNWRNYAWSMDFVRAFYDLGFVRRVLILLLMPKIMRREFQGLVENSDMPWFGWEGCDYDSPLYGVIRLVNLAHEMEANQ